MYCVHVITRKEIQSRRQKKNSHKKHRHIFTKKTDCKYIRFVIKLIYLF